MYIAKVDYTGGRITPNIIITIDTGMMTTNIKSVINATKHWLTDQGYMQIPKDTNGNPISISSIEDALSGNYRYNSTESWVKEYIGDAEKVFIGITATWVDPKTKKWLVKAYVFDKTLAY